jgi:hypothetical protein
LTFSYQYLCASSELDVGGGDDVEASQHTSAGNTSENVGAGTLHQGHKALVLDDLGSAIDRTVVLDGTTAGHHHAPSDGVDWVGGEAGHDGHGPTEEEADEGASTIANDDWLQRVVKSKVHTSVDEDTDARNDKTSVETTDTVGGEGLSVDIDETVVLSLTVSALVVVSQSGSGKVQGVDDGEGHGTSKTTGGDVGGKLLPLWGILGGTESGLDGVLEGKVEGLSWEVSEHVGQVSSPEWSNTLGGKGSLGAIHDAGVWLVESALLDHLILVLDEELDSLDWGGDGLGDTGGDTREHKVLEEVKFTSHS